MKRLVLICTALFLSGCAAAMPVKQEDMTYQKVIELPKQSKQQIFEKSKQWIASTFKSSKAVLEYDNKDEGVIIGNGSMDRPISAINITGGSLISFNMREDIKDNKARLTFSKFLAIVPPSQYGPGGERDILSADLEGIRANFDGLAQSLSSYILGGKSNDNW
jgi:hypothetical protein